MFSAHSPNSFDLRQDLPQRLPKRLPQRLPKRLPWCLRVAPSALYGNRRFFRFLPTATVSLFRRGTVVVSLLFHCHFIVIALSFHCRFAVPPPTPCLRWSVDRSGHGRIRTRNAQTTEMRCASTDETKPAKRRQKSNVTNATNVRRKGRTEKERRE